MTTLEIQQLSLYGDAAGMINKMKDETHKYYFYFIYDGDERVINCFKNITKSPKPINLLNNHGNIKYDYEIQILFRYNFYSNKYNIILTEIHDYDECFEVYLSPKPINLSKILFELLKIGIIFEIQDNED